MREVRSVCERERERERRKWRHHCRAKIGDEFTLPGSDVIIVALKLAMSLYTFPCQKSHFSFLCQKVALFVSPFTLPVSPFSNGHHYHCGAEIRNDFSLSVVKKFRPLCSDFLKWRDCSFHRKMNQIKAGPPPLPLEAILVIFGRRALIFFLFESSWKKMKNDTTLVRMRSGDHLGDAKMSKKGTSLRRI